MNEIFEQYAKKSKIGEIFFFADKIDGQYRLKSGTEENILFPLEFNHGFFVVTSKRYSSKVNEYDMLFFYKYESKESDKLEKLEAIEQDFKDYLYTLVTDLTINKASLLNESIVNELGGKKHHQFAPNEYIKLELTIKFTSNAC